MAFVDRSNTNGPASGDDYARASVRFLYLKATQGTTFTDATFKQRWAIARMDKVGCIGAYHYAAMGPDAAAECDHFAAVCGKLAPGQFRGCLDLEVGSPDAATAAWAERWVARYEQHYGHLPVLYGSTDFVGPLRGLSGLLRRCPWWRSEYGPDDGRWHPLAGGSLGATAHQYTSVSALPGLHGLTDQSVFCAPATAMLVPSPLHLAPLPKIAWEWAQWRLGIGRYSGHQGVPGYRPPAPLIIPKAYWRAVTWYQLRGL